MKIAIVAILGLFAGYNVYNSQEKDFLLSDIMLNNVEALAQASEADDKKFETCISGELSINTCGACGVRDRYCGTCQYDYISEVTNIGDCRIW